ncbi:MAG TPA: ADP-glyceromanno-heptose 6-epimerase [Firmicutes bacterium]|jgi:ADP-L-glycero-D-manno-heptose 6-epimerase|nr:ADP-glyceromanno-heptose 6-epimerase [Bacillota bacterium]
MFVITGGAGFIGSAIIWRLNELNITDILVVDSLGQNSDKWKNLLNRVYLDYCEKDRFIDDIRNNKAYLKNVKYLIHMGACSSTTETDNRYLIENNYEYTKTLAEYALRNNIRFVYASSAATYGAGELGYSDMEDGLHLLRPLNMYGYSKHLFDLYASKNKMLNKIVGLKFFNIYGPNEYHKDEMRSVVSKAYLQIKENRQVNLFKSYKPEFLNGEQKRDFLYIKEAVEIVRQIIFDDKIHGIFNIGSGVAHTWNDLVKEIFESLNIEPKISYIDMPENLKSKYQYFTKADMGKINNYIKIDDNYRFTLKNGIKDYVINYLEKEKYL